MLCSFYFKYCMTACRNRDLYFIYIVRMLGVCIFFVTKHLRWVSSGEWFHFSCSCDVYGIFKIILYIQVITPLWYHILIFHGILNFSYTKTKFSLVLKQSDQYDCILFIFFQLIHVYNAYIIPIFCLYKSSQDGKFSWSYNIKTYIFFYFITTAVSWWW